MSEENKNINENAGFESSEENAGVTSVVSTADNGDSREIDEGSMQVFTPQSEAPSEVQPRKKSKALVVGIVAGVIAVAVGTWSLATFFSPEKQLNSAFAATGAALAGRESVTDEFKNAETLSLLREGAYTAQADMSIKNFQNSTELSGLGVNLVSNVDNSAKVADLSIKGSYKGLNLDVLNFYTDDKDIIFGVPALCESTFMVAADNIASQLKASPVFSEYADEIGSDEDISIKLFDRVKDSTAAETEIAAIYGKNFGILSEKVKYSNAEPKEVSLNKGQVKCKGYAVNVPAGAVDEFFTNCVEEVFASEKVQGELMESAKMQYIARGYSTPEEYVDEVEKQAKELCTKASVGEVNAIFYVNGGVVVDSDITSSLTYEGTKVDVRVTGGLDTDSFKGNAVLTSGNDRVDINYADSIKKEDTLVETYELSAPNANGNTVGIKYTSDYNRSDGSLKTALNFEDDGLTAAELTAEGFLAGTDKGFNLDLSSIKLTADGENLAEFSCDFSLDELKTSVEKPEGTPVKILEISREEYEKLTKEISSKLVGIIMQLR